MNRRLSDFATRYLPTQTPQHPNTTPSDLTDLQETARLLRTELDQVIESQVAGDDACVALTHRIVGLRALAVERKRRRDVLRKRADEVISDGRDVREACFCEEMKWDALREDICRLREEIRRGALNVVGMRDESKRIQFTLATCGLETVFRLRADVQNGQMECEMDMIQLRKLDIERKEVQKNLETKRCQRDEIKSHAATLLQELQDAKTEYGLNQTRYNFLAAQLQGIGGKVPRDSIMLSSVQGLFTKMITIDVHARRQSMIRKTTNETTDHLYHRDSHRRTTVAISNIRQPHQQRPSNLTNSLQQTPPSSFGTDQLHKPPRIFKMGVTPNEIQPENNVYSKPSRQGISILFKEDDGENSIVSALTVDETEFPSLYDGTEGENECGTVERRA